MLFVNSFVQKKDEKSKFIRLLANSGVPDNGPLSGSPEPEELIGLLEKQDELISVLRGELRSLRKEITNLRNGTVPPKSDGGSNHVTYSDNLKEFSSQNGCHCGSGEKTISGALAEVESKLAAVNELQEKVTTLRLSYETSVKELQAKNAELSFTKEEVTAKEAHIKRLNDSLDLERRKAAEDSADVNRKLSEKTREYEDLRLENSSLKDNLRSLKNDRADKEMLIADLTKRLTNELDARKREEATLAARLTVLTEENATLRASLMSLRSGSEEFSPQVSNLLDDQRTLITSLKSECEYLADRLRKESSEHRKERKRLKKEIKDLNSRLDSMLSGQNIGESVKIAQSP